MAQEAITAAHRLEYKENVQLAIQQKTPKFPDRFTFQPNMSGRQAKIIDLFGADEPIINGPRGGDTPHIEPKVEQVWMKPDQLEWGRLIEKEDTIKTHIALQSPYVQNGAASIVRGKDDICAAAFFGPRIVGQDGTTTEAYVADTALNLVPVNYVPSGAAANSGLTFAKIAWGRTLMVTNEVDIESEDLFMAITGHEENDLYNQVQFLNKDYRERTVVDDKSKKVLSFMGIEFVRFQRLATVDGSPNITRAPLWCKSGMHFGEFDALETTIERNPQKKYRLHPYMETWVGATRSEDLKVVEIRCDRTA
jgi:hypothetical protein